jgi:ionotropic glutamate receptor
MKFIPESEDEVDQENPSHRPRRSFRSSRSFKDLIEFVDKREREIKEILRQKSKKRRRDDDQFSSPT